MSRLLFLLLVVAVPTFFFLSGKEGDAGPLLRKASWSVARSARMVVKKLLNAGGYQWDRIF